MYDSVRRVGRSTHCRSSTITTIGATSAASTSRSRVARAMANGSTGCVGALHRQRRAHRRRPRRGEADDAVEHAVEQLGEPRPGQLDLGLDAAQAHDPALRLVGQDQRGRFLDDRRLADPGLTDDRQRPALAAGGARGETGDGVHHVLAAVQCDLGRGGGRVGFGHVTTARGLPDAGETIPAAH